MSRERDTNRFLRKSGKLAPSAEKEAELKRRRLLAQGGRAMSSGGRARQDHLPAFVRALLER